MIFMPTMSFSPHEKTKATKRRKDEKHPPPSLRLFVKTSYMLTEQITARTPDVIAPDIHVFNADAPTPARPRPERSALPACPLAAKNPLPRSIG